MMGLTQRQLDTLRFITGFMEAHGRSPTLRDVQDGMRLKHPPRAFYALEHLVARGAITRTSRSIEILHPLPIPRAPDGAPLYFVRLPR